MRLADWIEREGLARAEVARKLGLSAGYVTDLCADRCWPGKETALKIVHLTGGDVSADDFLGKPEIR